jgi:translation initiation factor IF-2
MAEVTVTELAKTVGASVDRLLMQMKEAGLSHESADSNVSDEEKQILLSYLKGLHGENAGEPKKITLRRKTLSTLRSGNRKTVNIEVRKKRTYVKRSDEELQAQADLESEVKAREEAEALAKTVTDAEEPAQKSGTDDIEDKRLAAVAGRRKEAEDKVAQEKL